MNTTNQPATPESSFPLPWVSIQRRAEGLFYLRAANGVTVTDAILNSGEADRILAAVNNPAVKGLVEACDKADKFIGSLNAWQCEPKEMSSEAFAVLHEIRAALAAYRASIGGGQ